MMIIPISVKGLAFVMSIRSLADDDINILILILQFGELIFNFLQVPSYNLALNNS